MPTASIKVRRNGRRQTVGGRSGSSSSSSCEKKE